VKGIKGFHDIADYPEATKIPGLILYRFDANIVFYNVDYFRERVRAAIAAAETPVQWVVIDASSINVVDITAIQKVDELREELAARGIKLVSARVKQNLSKYFNEDWGAKRKETYAEYRYDTLKSAVRAFNNRVVQEEADGSDSN
jgi:MFS superfamily sulfate permease-like transporter